MPEDHISKRNKTRVQERSETPPRIIQSGDSFAKELQSFNTYPCGNTLFFSKSEPCTVKLQFNRFLSNDNLEWNIHFILPSMFYQKRNKHKCSPTTCQLWLLGASLRLPHLILQAGGLPISQAASKPQTSASLPQDLCSVRSLCL